MFIGILFVVLRYGLGRCGAKAEEGEGIPSVSRFTRHCSLVTIIIGLLLWFSGMVVAVHGSMKYKYKYPIFLLLNL